VPQIETNNKLVASYHLRRDCRSTTQLTKFILLEKQLKEFMCCKFWNCLAQCEIKFVWFRWL